MVWWPATHPHTRRTVILGTPGREMRATLLVLIRHRPLWRAPSKEKLSCYAKFRGVRRRDAASPHGRWHQQKRARIPGTHRRAGPTKAVRAVHSYRFCNGDCRCACVDTTDRRAACPGSRTVFPPRTTTSTASLRLTLPSALRRREARSAITTARPLAQPVQTASSFEPFVPGDRDSGLTAVSPTAIFSGTDHPGPVPLPSPSCGSH